MRSLKCPALLLVVSLGFPTVSLAQTTAPANVDSVQFVDWFETMLTERWSYVKVDDLDIRRAIEPVRTRAKGGASVTDLALDLQQVVALGRDGHAMVSIDTPSRGGYLPFQIGISGDRLVAFDISRGVFLDADHPYLQKIDGIEVAEWCKTASLLIAKGSSQLVLSRSVDYLELIQTLRFLRGAPASTTVEVELVSADRTSVKRLSMPLAPRRKGLTFWPPNHSRMLDGNIGYLRLPMMSTASNREIEQWMPKFREAEGLIVDVRDNPGGTRAVLRTLFNYLSSPDDRPWLANVTTYRREETFEPASMSGRFLHVKEDPIWTAQERQVIDAFVPTFQPEWTPNPAEFSPWHFMLLTHQDAPGVYHFRKPVVILMNGKCFSAADIFLSSLRGWRNVTLMGTPSGGGSAAAKTHRFNRELGVRLGSMVSFQRDGKLLDGRGVQPDVYVEPVPEYFIGQQDNVLETAIRHIPRPRRNSTP